MGGSYELIICINKLPGRHEPDSSLGVRAFHYIAIIFLMLIFIHFLNYHFTLKSLSDKRHMDVMADGRGSV